MRNQGAEVGRPVYYVSDRPEAYELWSEIDHEAAAKIGRLIAERAGRRFPGIEFRIDAGWHLHQPGMAEVAAYIEDHLSTWVDEAVGDCQSVRDHG
jgi:hypothetical protein